MSLGSHFPESFRDEYADRNIEVGSVIRKFVTWTRPPKEKRFVVVAIRSDKVSLATVVINTSLNENVNYTDELKSLHILFDSEGREYLEHESYIDCTDLYEENFSDLKQQLKTEPELLKGKMSEVDLAKVHRLIIQSTTIKPIKKKRYGFL